jgi:hypothetical protein
MDWFTSLVEVVGRPSDWRLFEWFTDIRWTLPSGD